jgi:tyrosine-protein kinase Etk/Wzc
MTEHPNASDGVSPIDADELGLLDVLIMLVRHKLLILGLPVLTALAVAGYSLMLPNIYKATTKILPPQPTQSATASILAQIGGVGGVLGAAAGLKNPNDVYVAMLKSRTVADKLNERFGLLSRWKIDLRYPSLMHEELSKRTRVSSGKDGIIVVEVEDADAKFAADLANAYVDELVAFGSVLAVTEGAQRRLFFEREFELAKTNLAKAEVAARRALESGGLAKVDDQGRAMVEVSARLRAEITVKEVQIGAMRANATEQNPKLQLAMQELDSMRRELRRVEGSTPGIASNREQNVQASDSLRLLRDYKYRETIFELLAKQYEMAKLDEAKDPSLIQVMDKAIEPDRRSSPQRTRMVLVSAFLAFVVAVLWVLVLEFAARGGQDRLRKTRLRELKRNLLSWK